MNRIQWLLAGIVAAAAASGAWADEDQDALYTLRYQLEPGQTLRWEVVHRGRIRATVADTTQTTETVSKSVKVWKVTDVRDDGSAVFEHSVENVDMWQKLSGSEETRYNSQKDATPPPGFEDAARRVGVPLMRVTLDPLGKTLQRENLLGQSDSNNQGQITIPLPNAPVAIGEAWTERHDLSIPLDSGGIKKVVSQQSFTLQSVKNDVATIQIATRILTPVHNPALEAKLIERESTGVVRFDLEAGRVLSQQIDLDRRVVGFRGPESCLHYLTRFTEELIETPPVVAQRP